jgi:hypothetical protein
MIYPESKYSTDILNPVPFPSVDFFPDSQAQYLHNQQVSVALESPPEPSLTLDLDNSTTPMDSHAVPFWYTSSLPVPGTGYFPDFNSVDNFPNTLSPHYNVLLEFDQ